MSRQCEARTRSGGRCQCQGRLYRRWQTGDRVREYLVCPQHDRDIAAGTFRPATEVRP